PVPDCRRRAPESRQQRVVLSSLLLSFARLQGWPPAETFSEKVLAEEFLSPPIRLTWMRPLLSLNASSLISTTSFDAPAPPSDSPVGLVGARDWASNWSESAPLLPTAKLARLAD